MSSGAVYQIIMQFAVTRRKALRRVDPTTPALRGAAQCCALLLSAFRPPQRAAPRQAGVYTPLKQMVATILSDTPLQHITALRRCGCTFRSHRWCFHDNRCSIYCAALIILHGMQFMGRPVEWPAQYCTLGMCCWDVQQFPTFSCYTLKQHSQSSTLIIGTIQ